MEWSKIKNIILIILLLLNGFLLLNVAGQKAREEQSRQAARQTAIDILRDNGVTVEDETVPREMELLPLRLERDLEGERELAAALLGGDVAVESRGGDVFRYYNQLGSVQFHSGGEFQAQFEQGAYPLTGLAAEHAGSVLKHLGFVGREIENTVSDGDGSVTFQQELDGIPVLNCQAVAAYRQGQLVSITNGRRVMGTPAQDSGRTTITTATALMRTYNALRELGDIYSRVDRILSAYTLSVNISGTARLTPVWIIRTDTGTYQLDTVTGTLSRASEWAGMGIRQAQQGGAAP